MKITKLFTMVIGVIVGVTLAYYSIADTISLTPPPWDYCGWHETKAGTAFDCIRFDVTPIAIK